MHAREMTVDGEGVDGRAGVRAIGWALPSWEVRNEDVSAWSGLDPAFIEGKLGVATRRWLADDETPTDLAARALEDLRARAPELADRPIGLLVVVTQNPDFRLPHSSALLQDRAGIGTDAACFDINLGCSGWVYALSAVRGFMQGEGIDDAVIVTCDPYSRAMRRQDRDVVGLFGDAATATWLSRGSGAGLGAADLGTDGSGASKLIVAAGGARDPLQDVRTDPATGPVAPDSDAMALRMDGRAIFNFLLTRVPASVSRCLERNGLEMDEVDLLVFHQASRYLLEQLTRRLDVDPARVVIDMADVGNTVSSTVPLTLARLGERGALEGRTVLVSGFGVGLSWATNVLRYQTEG